MLTIRQNLMETIKGGNPDRFVKQYEAFTMIMNTPITRKKPPIGGQIVNEWGVTTRWPEGQPGAFPVHDEEHIVVKDITKWRDTVNAPNVKFSDKEWEAAKASADAINRNEQFVTAFIAPGIFEQVHYLMSMEEALMAFYEEPESMHELINYLVEWELALAKEFVDHIQPDAIFHHDDWGSQLNSFISPEMFEEFLVPAYKKIYGYYKENGVEIIIHHSDSYGANLVPSMIEMGIDIWQGCMSTNNLPELINQYGEKITFMGGLDNGKLDKVNWSPEEITEYVEKTCKENGKSYYIPCLTMGGPGSIFDGVYDTANDAIDKMSTEMFL